jgi:hypothetical protein
LQSPSVLEFAHKWRASTRTESAASQEHFIDLCHLLGEPTPGTDPTGDTYAFEKALTKTGGGNGFADVWQRGHFAWEYKGKHHSLTAAYDQLLKYREALDNPPLLVVCDLNNFEVHTNFTDTAKQVYRFDLADMANGPLMPSGGSVPPLDVLRALFDEPDRLRPQHTLAHVTEQAAKEFAKLADSLRSRGEEPALAARFLVRLLFCLFAEDVGLLPKDLFTRLVEGTRAHPGQFATQLGQLFHTMATGGYFGVDQIAYFNGGLFSDDRVLDLDGADLTILLEASRLDWASVEPAIFGTLFERGLDPNKRAQLGAHYTSRDDILLIVEPVVLAPLRRQWALVQEQTLALLQKRDAAQGPARAHHARAAHQLLLGFADELASTRILDPAAGSGNFLYLALRLLMDLEKEAISFGLVHGLQAWFPKVGPEQLHGIETNLYAHELAQAVVWIGYIQWLRDNGFGQPSPPILKPLATIKQMDALLAYDERGQPVEPAWPEAEMIIGNPAFLGGKRLRTELGSKYVDDLFRLYDGRVPREADLVAYWFEHARAMIAAGKAKRAGLLATQSIRRGANRRVLERIKQTGDIFYAQADRPWVLEGAAVRVSMVGFDNGTEVHRLLNETKGDDPAHGLADVRPVPSIHANLTAALDVTRAQRLRENADICFQGPVKIGSFEIEPAIARQMLTATNLHGKPNSDVVRPWLNASDVTGRPRDLWIVDFGSMPLEQAALYEAPFEYIRRVVKPQRDTNARVRRRDYWWHHGETVPGMRAALEPRQRFVCTPRVALHRLFVWVRTATLPDSRLYVFAREDDYFLGVLHSRIHESWSLATSSRHGDGTQGGRPTYNNTTCFETFPFPWPMGQEPLGDPKVEAIAAAARALVSKRDAWLNPAGVTEAELKARTLTKLYNERPMWLQLAHETLDNAVLKAYDWPSALSDGELLERVFTLNRERKSRESTDVGQLLLPDPAVVTKEKFERARKAAVEPETQADPSTRHRRPA